MTTRSLSDPSSLTVADLILSLEQGQEPDVTRDLLELIDRARDASLQGRAMRPVRRFLDLSTAHLKPATRDLLDDRSRAPVPTYQGQYACFAWVCPEKEEDDNEIPPDLRVCFKAAREAGCEYVMFDCDGPTVADLPEYPDD